MKSAVIVVPGSNCDRDMAEALRLVSGRAPEMVWHRESELPAGLDLLETVEEANAGLVEALRTFPGATADEFATHVRGTVHAWLDNLDEQQG